jgi:2-phosphosulfolactate phosphatase
VVIIVDVMSFSSCVEIAVGRGATIFPYRWRDDSAKAFAESMNAELAASRGRPEQSPSPYSLSPKSLLGIPPHTRLVLPSPNGSVLSLATQGKPTLLGCLRNARAVARAALDFGPRVAVIPAGERWKEDGTLRPAIEDFVGAGAIIAHLRGSMSPEAAMALACFQVAAKNLEMTLKGCASGKELIAMGYEEDVNVIAELDVSPAVPLLSDGAFAAFSI